MQPGKTEIQERVDSITAAILGKVMSAAEEAAEQIIIKVEHLSMDEFKTKAKKKKARKKPGDFTKQIAKQTAGQKAAATKRKNGELSVDRLLTSLATRKAMKEGLTTSECRNILGWNKKRHGSPKKLAKFLNNLAKEGKIVLRNIEIIAKGGRRVRSDRWFLAD